jgi:hypothetical protein
MLQVVGVDIIDRDNTHSGQPESDGHIGEDHHVDAAGFERRVHWNLNASIQDMPSDSDTRLRREVFHLINSRFLTDGINTKRWRSLVKECWELLVPGGWLQMVEPVWMFQSDNGKTELLQRLTAWWDHYAYALQQMDKNARIGRGLSSIMGEAKFQEVKSETQSIPVAGWRDGVLDSAYISMFIDISG